MNNVKNDTILSIFGGEERCSDEFPETYKAYQNSLNGKISLQRAEIHVLSVGKIKGSQDDVSITVLAICKDTDMLDGYIVCKVNIDGAWKHETNFTANYVVMNFTVKENYLGAIRVTVMCPYVQHPIGTTVFYLNQYDLNATISSKQIDHPIKNPKIKPHDKIKIYYYHEGYAKETYDYSYGPADQADPDNNKCNIELPSKGWVELNLDPGVKIDYIKNSTLTFTNLETIATVVGSAKYPKVISHGNLTTPVIESECKISWNIDEDWKHLARNFFGRYDDIKAEYNYSIEVKLTNHKSCTVYVSNSDNVNTIKNGISVPKMLMKIDCFAEGTMIKMADGTQKAIEQIRAGEYVCCGRTGQDVKVLGVNQAPKGKGIIRITLMDKRTLISSAGHPVSVDGKMISACRVQAGMKVETDKGSVEVEMVDPACDVFNDIKLYAIDLESEHQLLIANGFVVGDSSVEAQVTTIESNVRNLIDKKWLKEYDYLNQLSKLCEEDKWLLSE